MYEIYLVSFWNVTWNTNIAKYKGGAVYYEERKDYDYSDESRLTLQNYVFKNNSVNFNS